MSKILIHIKRLSLLLLPYLVYGQLTTDSFKPQTINPQDIKNYDHYPDKTQTLIQHALALTTKNLTYQYGSADPKNGGMDCSGTIKYLLTTLEQYNIPRQSDQFYTWTLTHGNFYRAPLT